MRESHALPRLRADAHPLSAAPSPPLPQGDVVESGNSDFFDPLRGTDNEAKVESPDPDNLSNAVDHHPTKEWTSFRRLLMQRFPVTKMVSMSSMPDLRMRNAKCMPISITLFILLLFTYLF
ncbi:uncharacterized protein LOC107606552 [Arachis ipaensis]|uniref:uncharacterized protein LOC107606552 n=1 Tax=Arachis ipaensis TaxID=130454 RepID=UPI000A2B8E55|nr:uncharacterized protein LOC107606552 [Arachis ipaensis]